MSVAIVAIVLCCALVALAWLGLHYGTRIVAQLEPDELSRPAVPPESNPAQTAPSDMIGTLGYYRTRSGGVVSVTWLAEGQAGNEFRQWNARTGRASVFTVLPSDIVERVS